MRLLWTVAIVVLVGCSEVPSPKPTPLVAPVTAPAGTLTTSTSTGAMIAPTVKENDDSPSCNCDQRGLSLAVLKRIDDENLGDWNSSNVGPGEEGTRADVDREAAGLIKIARWAATLKDRCLREQYDHLLSYFQDDVKAAYEELETHKNRNHYADFEAENKREFAERDQCLRSGMVPKPQLREKP